MHRINAPSFKNPLNKRHSKIGKNLNNTALFKRSFPKHAPPKKGICSKCRCKKGGVNLRKPRQFFKENETNRFSFLFSILDAC